MKIRLKTLEEVERMEKEGLVKESNPNSHSISLGGKHFGEVLPSMLGQTFDVLVEDSEDLFRTYRVSRPECEYFWENPWIAACFVVEVIEEEEDK